MPDNNVVVSGTFTINDYTITFETGGGTVIPAITQNYGTDITAPQDPARVGYTFTGWSQSIPETMPAGDLVITAGWQIDTYTITYNLDGGAATSNPTSYQVTTPTITLLPTSKLGYTFVGWFDNSDIQVTEITLGSTGDVTLTAKFNIDTYTITYNLAGGNPTTNPTSYKVTTPTIILIDE